MTSATLELLMDWLNLGMKLQNWTTGFPYQIVLQDDVGRIF